MFCKICEINIEKIHWILPIRTESEWPSNFRFFEIPSKVAWEATVDEVSDPFEIEDISDENDELKFNRALFGMLCFGKEM